ncbi:MAG: hypothetical protein IT534_01395 [Bauldia sp.]|nr:hypothetical protein [Bauldia sp.]
MLPRLLSEINFDRFRAAHAFRATFTIDGTTDRTITIDFDVDANGNAAIVEALALRGR